MRTDRRLPRGEAGRVAARVRELLDEHAERQAGVDDAERFGSGEGFEGVGRLNDFDDLDDGDDVVGDDFANGGRRSTGSRAHSERPSMWQRLLARVPVRVDPGRRSALAIGVAVLVAAIVTGAWVVANRPQAAPVSATAPSIAGSSPLVSSSGPQPAPSSSVAAPVPARSNAAPVVVDVAGKVHRPGLYRLSPGARVNDAISSAGGPLNGVDLSSLNLAARVVDGQQIAVGKTHSTVAGGAPPAGAPAADGGTGAAGGGSAGGAISSAPVNLNTATLEQLETLPGIGPALGQRILDYRSAHGGSFTSVAQLDDVSGIGTVTFARLKPLVTV